MLHLPKEVDPLYVELRLPLAQRSAIDDLQELDVQGDTGQTVQLGALGYFEKRTEDQTIYHKNLERVVYVFGEVAGRSPAEAIIRIVAVRTRPIRLTAGTTLLGNWVITLDPIFSGLAWSVIFGILTSTLFTLIVIPVVYWLLYRKSQATHLSDSPASDGSPQLANAGG